MNCHAYGPEACNTCHGTFNADPNDTSSWAPPPDVAGNNSPSLRSVGAHSQLVNGGSLGGPYSCIQCHILPADVMAPTHLDTLPAHAEITFGPIATDNNAVQPVWTPDNATCSAVYCHGNFELGHSGNTVVWTNQDGSQIQCGTCHALPPPSPHDQLTIWCLCHSSVVDESYNIIAPWLHVNGVTNF